jgi:hypothetical protein
MPDTEDDRTVELGEATLSKIEAAIMKAAKLIVDTMLPGDPYPDVDVARLTSSAIDHIKEAIRGARE